MDSDKEAQVRCELSVPGAAVMTGGALLDAFERYFDRGGFAYAGVDVGVSESVGVVTAVDLVLGKVIATVRLDSKTKSGRELIERLDAASGLGLGVSAMADLRGTEIERVILEAQKSEPK